jgi:hypothetical protein
MRVLVVEGEVHLAQSQARGLTAEGDVEVVHDGTDGLWRARYRRLAPVCGRAGVSG